jgi:general nucleoside transport system permease protein
VSLFASSLQTAIAAGAVIAIAGIGELLLERTGVMNLGIEGIISLGALGAVLMALSSSDPWVCLLAAIAVGVAAGGLFGLFAVVVRLDQVLVGLAIFLVGIGLTNQIGGPQGATQTGAEFGSVRIPGLPDIPEVGEALFDQPILVYVAYLVLPLVAAVILFRTRHGIKLRAIGENPAAADAAGISVMRIRFAYCLVAGGLAAAAGAYLMLSFTPSFSQDPGGGRGWIALAAVIFAAWRPWRLAAASLFFGAMVAVGFVAEAENWNIPSVVFSMLPYMATLALMVLFVLRLKLARRELRQVAPAALAVAYFREER